VTDDDYPALYRSADAASKSTKRSHVAIVWAQSGCLILGAAVGMLLGESRVPVVIAALLFLASLAVTIFARTQQFQQSWYQARALAESIKATSWLYMMGADPYNVDDVSAARVFRVTLTQLLKDNRSLGDHFESTPAADEQLTPRMKEVRGLNVGDKVAFYSKYRIDDQRQWYTQRATANRAQGKLWFRILVVLYLLATVSVLIRVAAPGFNYYASGLLAVAASSVLTWIQLKRYSEIAAAYVLTSHEIGIIQQGLGAINDAEQLSTFVADAESAFSREHTQWAARRRE
jgi:hypothetical protein